MSIALCFGLVRSFAGQTLTQRLQPVQSSGATWMVNCCPLCSLALNSVDVNVAGASDSALLSYTLARIAACGKTSAHWLHWIQIFESHTGISSAMLRFSHLAVAVGHVPSTGNALTGSRSPLPASMTAVIFWTKSGACSETSGGRR